MAAVRGGGEIDVEPPQVARFEIDVDVDGGRTCVARAHDVWPEVVDAVNMVNPGLLRESRIDGDDRLRDRWRRKLLRN